MNEQRIRIEEVVDKDNATYWMKRAEKLEVELKTIMDGVIEESDNIASFHERIKTLKKALLEIWGISAYEIENTDVPTSVIISIKTLAADALSEPEEHELGEGDWYCPKCDDYLSWQQVTFEETHQTCGTPVILSVALSEQELGHE